MPGESQPSGVLVVDFLQWAKSLFAVTPPVAHPIPRFSIGVRNSRVVDVCRFRAVRGRQFNWLASAATAPRNRRQRETNCDNGGNAEGSVSSSHAIHVSCIAIAANFCSGKKGRGKINIV